MVTYRIWKDNVVVDVILKACCYDINERARIFCCSCSIDCEIFQCKQHKIPVECSSLTFFPQ